MLSWILQPSKLATPWTRTPPPCEPREQGQAPSIGAMEEMSQKVQNASSHPKILRTHKVTVKFSGAMDESSGNVQSANSYSILRTCKAALRQFSGAMDEMSQKVQNASSHPWILPHTQRHTVNSAGRLNVSSVGSIGTKTHAALQKQRSWE